VANIAEGTRGLSAEEVAACKLTDEQARSAVQDYVRLNPGADACDIAEALRMPMRRAFAIADALIAEGKIEVAEE